MKLQPCLALLIAASVSAAHATVVINEIDYDMNGAGDSLEFVELYNNGVSTEDISGWSLELLNGSDRTGVVYTTVVFPGVAGSNTTTLAPGAFYVVGTTALGAKNQAFAAATDAVQNGSADGARVKNSAGVVQDAVMYEQGSSIVYTGPADSFEGNHFRGIDATTTPNGQTNGTGVSIGRYPDGADTNDNAADFFHLVPTPTLANPGTIALPYSNDFASVPAGAGITTPFVTPSVVTLPTATVNGISIPPSPDPVSPNSAIRIVDQTGGGDQLIFGGPGTTGKLNVSGYWYLKASHPTNMTGEITGIEFRNTKSLGFFGTARSTTSAFGYENGLSVTYRSTGAVTGSQGLSAGSGQILVDLHSHNPESDTALVAPVTMAGDRLVPFFIRVDPGTNQLRINVDGQDLYMGAIPASLPNFGGVAFGVRTSGGTPPLGVTAGAYFDAISMDNTGSVPVSLSSYGVE